MTNNMYFNYLCGLIGKRKEYGTLLMRLYDIDFYSIIPNDDNRAADGIELRREYCDFEHRDLPFKDAQSKCTVLEMLIGLAYRLEFESNGLKNQKSMDEWFWVLIDNLKLTKFTDRFLRGNIEFLTRDIDNIVLNLIRRNYQPNGEGGLFPLKWAKKDQRTTEIWYQMSEYILEKYPI